MIDFAIDFVGDFLYDVVESNDGNLYGTGICWDIYTYANDFVIAYNLRIYIETEEMAVMVCLQ